MQEVTQTAPQPDTGVVNEAVSALRLFGDDLDIASAARLLPMWHYYSRLTAVEYIAVLRHFAPDTDQQDVEEYGYAVESFRVGQQVERAGMKQTLDALERIAARLAVADHQHRLGYSQGYTDAIDGRAPEFEVAR